MSKKRLIIIAAVLAAAILAVVLIVRDNRYRNLQSSAIALYEQGQYEEASGLFEQLKEEDAKDWLEKCAQGLTDQEAKALLEGGKPAEALALLKEKYPASGLYVDALKAQAAALADEGKPAEAKQLLMDEGLDIPELTLTYEQMTDEAAFRDALASADLKTAEERIANIESTNDSIHRLSDEEIEAMRAELTAAGKHAEAQNALDQGLYAGAYNAFDRIEDREGKSAVIDAAEAAGDFDAALYFAVRSSDIERAESLFAQLEETGGLPLGGDSESWGEWTLTELTEINAVGALDLARKIMDRAVLNARTMIAEGKASEPWRLLASLKNCAGPLWTDEMESMMTGCTEELPENGIYRDTGLARAAGGSEPTATVTVINNSNQAVIFDLWQDTENFIYVFVRPGSQYSFTVAAGVYSPGLMSGDHWFGAKEGFGVWTAPVSVEVNNGKDTVKQGDTLDGNYFITLE